MRGSCCVLMRAYPARTYVSKHGWIKTHTYILAGIYGVAIHPIWTYDISFASGVTTPPPDKCTHRLQFDVANKFSTGPIHFEIQIVICLYTLHTYLCIYGWSYGRYRKVYVKRLYVDRASSVREMIIIDHHDESLSIFIRISSYTVMSIRLFTPGIRGKRNESKISLTECWITASRINPQQFLRIWRASTDDEYTYVRMVVTEKFDKVAWEGGQFLRAD